MKSPTSKVFWQAFLGLSALLAALAFSQTIHQAGKLEIALLGSKWTVLLGLLLLNLVAGLLLLWKPYRERFQSLLDTLDFSLSAQAWRAVGFAIAILAAAMFWFLRLGILVKFLPGIFPALWFFTWLSLLAAAGLRLAGFRSWAASFAIIVILQSVLFVVYGRLRLVSADPFSLGYSEGGRYYYASLLFAKSVYGIDVPLSGLLPSRYFLQAIPFLIGSLPIWAHRLWQALLWIGLTAGTSYLLIRRLKLAQRNLALLMMGWFFIYLFQGPIYYHLQICVIIILLGFSRQHPIRTLLAVVAASLWAGISRINWYPVPAMLAITLYLLEEPVSRHKDALGYARAPIVWGILALSAFLPQTLYRWLASPPAGIKLYGGSLEMPLLFYRLLPNPSFPPGILLAITIVSLPLWISLYMVLNRSARNLHWLRLLGLGLIVLILFGGGLLVTTKIGGGAELHDMDAYMIVLGVITAYFLAGRVQGENATMIQAPAIPWPVLATALILPAAFSILQLAPPPAYDKEGTAQDLQTLQDLSGQTVRAGGEVLFIAERQLLTFDLVKVPLVPDYEVATLMDMAMAGNMEYLNQFYADLRAHRFAIIIARKQSTALQEPGAESFAEENNIWNQWISTPLLCSYEPAISLAYANVQVFKPREQQGPNCP